MSPKKDVEPDDLLRRSDCPHADDLRSCASGGEPHSYSHSWCQAELPANLAAGKCGRMDVDVQISGLQLRHLRGSDSIRSGPTSGRATDGGWRHRDLNQPVGP